MKHADNTTLIWNTYTALLLCIKFSNIHGKTVGILNHQKNGAKGETFLNLQGTQAGKMTSRDCQTFHLIPGPSG